MTRTFAFIISVSICYIAMAQELIPDLVTDRPDQTESALTVPLKSVQIEAGFLVENSSDYTNMAYHTALIRYGLLEDVELRLGFEYLGERNKSTEELSTGLSPLYLGTKIGVYNERDWQPQIAILVGLSMPFSADEHFKPDYTAADIRLAFSNTINNYVSLSYNLGVEWDGYTAVPAYNYSIALGFTVSEQVALYAESYGQLITDKQSYHLIDAGVTVLLAHNIQLDGSAGIGLNETAIDNYFSIGLSYRIPR